MKIVIVNGSPRKGNTYSAINAFVEGAKDNNDIEVIDSYKLKISPCVACGTCECYKGCVAKDDLLKNESAIAELKALGKEI